MPAPICIELVASPPPEAALVQTLVDSCSRAAGGPLCVLDANCGAGATARVRVTFAPGYGRVLVEGATSNRLPRDAKEIFFRDEDPPLERFRATGLVIAGRLFEPRSLRQPAVASARTGQEAINADSTPPEEGTVPESPPGPTPERSPESVAPAVPPSAASQESETGPVWSAAALFDVGLVEPGMGVRFAVDVPIGSVRRFVTLAVSHEQTLRRDPNGVDEQHQMLAVGGGIALPLIERQLTLRLPLQVAVEEQRASVVQFGSGRQDAGSKLLYAAVLGLDFVWSFSDRIGVFAGAFGTWTTSRTDVQVGGQTVTSIAPFQLSLALGLNVRIP